MSIRFIVDSACDINDEIAEKYNIRVLPVTVTFSDGDYKDKIDLKIEDLFKKIEELDEIPTTAQITPNIFVDILEEELKNNDQVILMTMGGNYSGTYNSAMLAKSILESDKLFVVDSESITIGYGHLVYETAKKIATGASIEEVLEHIEECKKNITTFALFDTLENLKKGGRLPAHQAFIGSLLNIKIIVQIKKELVLMDKVRGMRKAMGWVIDYIKENNIDLKNKEVVLINSSGDNMMIMKELLEQELETTKFIFLEMGAVVGTHGGPGSFGVSFLKDN